MPLSSSQLNALPYEVSPFSQGMQGEDFRQQLRAHGEPVRWWKAYRAPDGVTGPGGEAPERNGLLYIEQDTDGIRVLVYETQQDVYDVEGQVLFARGQTAIACLPDEMELARGDRVLLTTRTLIGRYVLPAGETQLPFQHIASIVSVFTADGTLNGDTYEVGEDEQSIFWLDEAPESDCAVGVRYHPLYVFLDVSDRQAPLGTDGRRLPQRGILTKERI